MRARPSRQPFLIAALSALGLAWTAVAALAATTTGPLWPTRDWSTASPEAEGIDSDSLTAAFDYIASHHVAIHSLQIVRDGRLVLDAYFYPFADSSLHDIASVTKSVTTTLVGIDIGAGTLRGVREPVLPLFQGVPAGRSDERKQRMTVEDLLTMRSGLACDFGHGEATLNQMRQSSHWTQFTLSLPMAKEPGTEFVYCSSGMHLLSAMIRRTTGQSAFDYARDRLFGPLGIRDATWPQDADSVSNGWGDLRLHPRDMAKLGYLWLHDGRWSDLQIVPADYMRAAVTAHTRTTFGDEYGYGIWVRSNRPLPVFEGLGRGGQRISVVPSKNLVVVMTGGGFEPGDVGAFIGRALESDGPLPENKGAQARLASAVAAARRAPPAHALAPIPAWARAMSSVTFHFDANDLGIAAMTFALDDPANAGLRVAFSDGHVEQHPIGFDGVPRFSPGTKGQVGLSGSWDPSALLLSYDLIGGIDEYEMRIQVSGESLSVSAKERSRQSETTLHGHLQP